MDSTAASVSSGISVTESKMFCTASKDSKGRSCSDEIFVFANTEQDFSMCGECIYLIKKVEYP